MGRIIVVDGTSNAGKTTLCDNLQRNMKNIIVVQGASAFARVHHNRYPKIPPIPKKIQEEKLNQRFFFNLELDRLIEANKLAEKNYDVFMDRGILEILSVAYSFENINGWEGIYENARKLYDEFISVVTSQGVRFPDSYLWLQANADEVIKRNQTRQIETGQKLSENEWINTNLINNQIEFFEKLCISENQDRFILIDTNNKSKREVLTKVRVLLNLKEKEREINND